MAFEKVSKAAEIVSEKAMSAGEKAAGKSREVADIAAIRAKDGALAVAGAAQDVKYERRQRKYNPLFEVEYLANDFDLPKMIVIADEDERKGIDVCEGAIGWMATNGKLEVIFLYEEFLPRCGLSFYPRPVCDAVYYVDPFDSERYINLACYFETAKQDKITELSNIAFALGATYCRIESFEEEKQVVIRRGKFQGRAKSKGKAAYKAIPVDASVDASLSADSSSEHFKKLLFEQHFESNKLPARPSLHWFRNDREIQSLIQKRCEGDGNIKNYRIQLDSAMSSTMSEQLAIKIDATVKKIGASSNISFDGEHKSEMRSRFELTLEF